MDRGYGEGDVTIVSAPKSSITPTQQSTVASDGTAVVHKSLHKKKSTREPPRRHPRLPGPNSSSATSTASPTAPAKTAPPAPASPAAPKPAAITPPAVASTTHIPAPVEPKPAAVPQTAPIAKATPTLVGAGSGPAIETGLPVARHAGAEGDATHPGKNSHPAISVRRAKSDVCLQETGYKPPCFHSRNRHLYGLGKLFPPSQDHGFGRGISFHRLYQKIEKHLSVEDGHLHHHLLDW